MAWQVIFPPTLTARQRAILHQVAEAHGLGHISTGDGEARCISIGKLDGEADQVCRLVKNAGYRAVAAGSLQLLCPWSS